MKMNKIVLVVLACTIPAFFFMQVLQAYQYNSLEKDIQLLEEQQKDWIEKNKKLIAGISLLSTPERIDTIARTELDLQKIDSTDIIRLGSE